MSTTGSLVYSSAVGRGVLAPVVRWGYRRYRADGETPSVAYRAMRKLYGSADPGPWARFVAAAAADHPPSEDFGDDPDGVARGVTDDLVAALRRDGFVRLPGLLDPAACDDLEALAASTPARLTEPVDDGAPSSATFDPHHPAAVRYDLAEEAILRSSAAQRLVGDASLLTVAQAYLGAAPVQDLVAMWWSAATGVSASDAAAQQFHFDLDRLRFLKFFVYLTDVDETTGPHVYVRGSHGPKPAPLRRDGRHRDEEVEAAFPGAAATIVGPRGTMFLADTLGLHKGLALEEGHRLVFQLEWATSLFGAPYERPRVATVGPELAAAVARHPEVFRRFQLDRR